MEQEPEDKKLRSSEPDLKVVLGKEESQSVEWYHSQNLACKSKYIDAMLTAPMKEKEERTISFPDIDSETWQKMLDFLDNPLAARKMSARDAMELAPWYDKYEFGLGRELCEEVMSEFLSTQSLNKEVQKHSLDIEFVIDLVKVAHDSNLGTPFKRGMVFILDKMDTRGAPPFDHFMFTKERLAKLAPLLVYARDHAKKFGFRPRYSQFSRDQFSRDSSVVPLGLDPASEDFVNCFVDRRSLVEAEDLLSKSISHIELSGTCCSADGKYAMDDMCWDAYIQSPENRSDRWGHQVVTRFTITSWKPMTSDTPRENEEWHWAIVREHGPTAFFEDGEPDEDTIIEKACWIAPYSCKRRLPPLEGWISDDPLARGKPKLKYVFNESLGG